MVSTDSSAGFSTTVEMIDDSPRRIVPGPPGTTHLTKGKEASALSHNLAHRDVLECRVRLGPVSGGDGVSG
jgi:hypothetical protein